MCLIGFEAPGQPEKELDQEKFELILNWTHIGPKKAKPP